MLKYSRLKILILCVIVSLCFASCLGIIKKYKETKKVDLEKGQIYLDNFLKTDNFKFETLRGRAKVTYIDDDEKYKLDSLIILKMPDSMRIDMVNVFDQPILIMNYSNDELFIFSVEDNQYERRSKSDKNLGYLLERFDLLIPFIFGDFHQIRDFTLESCLEHDKGKLAELFLKKSIYGHRILLNLLLEVESERIYQLKYKDLDDESSEREYLISYLKYDDGDSMYFPESVEMKIIKGKQSGAIRLNFKEYVLNKEVSNNKFLFDLPEVAIKGRIPRIFDWLN
jgi:hypothetical protein